MAHITLESIRHSYVNAPVHDGDWALSRIDLQWEDGGAFALLGPSGCGKTTLLNIISGLIAPSEGRVLFDSEDVTVRDTVDRHVAQVFQFPVVYDTMSVFDNLAFPLRNRGVSEAQVRKRVQHIAQMLDLESQLGQRAAGLSADGKQKISLGRGLVRADVNVIMFDEPLTVIDPHLKWVLRSKLKQVHQQIGTTMIYVTHDQTEALTFADKVVVMYEGMVVQVGTPVELFEAPRHTFVGHFIGSPGMNILPCKVENDAVVFDGQRVASAPACTDLTKASGLEVGVRPEFVRFSDHGMPVSIVRVHDLGRYKIVELQRAGQRIKLVADEGVAIPSDNIGVIFDPAFTRVYQHGWVVDDVPGAQHKGGARS